MSKQEIEKQETTVVKTEKKEGKVKAWFNRNKGTIKIVLGGTVLATAIGAAWYYFKKHQEMEYDEENDCWYIPMEKEAEEVKTISHSKRGRHMLLDSDSPVSKFGMTDYDIYPKCVEIMPDEYGAMHLSDLGEVGEALKDTLPDVDEDSEVWALFNITRHTDDGEEPEDISFELERKYVPFAADKED